MTLLIAGLAVSAIASLVGLVVLLLYCNERNTDTIYVHQRCQRSDCEACNAWERGRQGGDE